MGDDLCTHCLQTYRGVYLEHRDQVRALARDYTHYRPASSITPDVDDAIERVLSAGTMTRIKNPDSSFSGAIFLNVGNKYVLKLSPIHPSPSLEHLGCIAPLDMETRIIERIRELAGVCPNLLAYEGTFTFNANNKVARAFYDTVGDSAWQKMVQGAGLKRPNDLMYRASVSPFVGAQTMLTLLVKRVLDDESVIDLLLQLALAFQLLDDNGIRHGDAHLNNIFAIEQDTDTPIVYHQQNVVLVGAKFRALLFDWDFGGGAGVGPNCKVHELPRHNMDRGDSRFDMFTVLWAVWEVTRAAGRYPLTQEALKACVPDHGRLFEPRESLEAVGSFPGRLCPFPANVNEGRDCSAPLSDDMVLPLGAMVERLAMLRNARIHQTITLPQ
jgi:hypothetical protein